MKTGLFLFVAMTLFSSEIASANPAPPADAERMPESQPFIVSAPTLFIGTRIQAIASRLTGKLSWLEVVDVQSHSIAYTAGLRPKDRILSWNGVSLVGLKPEFLKTLKAESDHGVIRVTLGVKRRGLKKPVNILLVWNEVDGSAELSIPKK